ncbi:DUF4192 domain-containing protein [Nonomuraea sp. NN258]|uniref:DUF4192 domain-containing protein n=1 Tax=Nonomuraea antri TaxID=2730852 RepID=UPI001567F440|nr:DUF4192 domain-containing protein [Nonomuraea antri]NRQ38791.1 DUF4192 domain-containing protein [Nonomuraea antri]
MTDNTVRLSAPADLIAIVPYILGFHPALSLVILAFNGSALATGLRYDLPATQDEAGEIITGSLDILRRDQIAGICLVGYGPGNLVTPLMDGLCQASATTAIEITEMLRCEDGRYWSYTCTMPDCCPPEGTPYDVTTSQAAVTAVMAGLSTLPDRASFADQLAPVEGPDREAVRAATAAARERAENLLIDQASARYWYEEGRARVHDAFARSAADQPLSPEEVAWLGVLLTSVCVRDAAWTMIGTYTEQAHIKLWTEVMRRVEPAYLPAPASLLAFAAYHGGAGTLARIAVDRALAVNPRYSMAHLIDCSLSHGIPTEAIRGMRIGGQAGEIDAQVDREPRAALPVLPGQE